MIPPLITVGSTPPASSSAAIIEVVVVLPCVPATATVDLSRISSASISARRTTGMRVLERGLDLGIGALDRGRGDDHRRIAEILRRMADRDRDAAVAQPLDDIALGDVGALHRVAEVVHHLGDARHADAADADEMDRADVGGDALHANAALLAAAAPTGDRRRPARRGSRPGRRGRAPRSGRPQLRARAAAFGERLRVEPELLDLLGELGRR